MEQNTLWPCVVNIILEVEEQEYGEDLCVTDPFGRSVDPDRRGQLQLS